MKTAEEILNEVLVDVEDRPVFFREQDVADLIGQAQKEGQSNPKIKQLEWCEEQCSNEDIPYNHVKANSPLGTYTIEWKGWKDYDDKTIFLDGVFVSMGGDVLEEAMMSAQSDFEARVKECLITEL